MGGNTKLLRKILRDFYTDHASDVPAIQSALDSRNFEQARRLAHTVKGIAANELRESAGRLEALLKAEDFEGAGRQLNEFASILEAFLPGLASLDDAAAPAIESTTTGPLDPDVARRLFDELDALLEEMDPDSQEKLQEFSSFLGGHADPAQLQTLTTQIDGFEFEEARTSLQSLRQALLPKS